MMKPAEYANLRFSVQDRIALVELNRPQVLNALDARTLDELEAVFNSQRDDPEVGAVILTGIGEKAFAAGADIKELAGLDAFGGRQYAMRGQQVLGLISDFAKPVIGAVNGFCLGGGCELALACHIRIAADNARFGQPEVKLGLIPGYGGTQRLPRLIGLSRALELLLSGDVIDAREAERIGLVNRVVEASELIPHCRQLAERILKNAPLAVGLALQAAKDGIEVPLFQGLVLEASAFALSCGTEDMKEGTNAFIQKRKPEFRAR
jgi:enoyl-CoA hydratase